MAETVVEAPPVVVPPVVVPDWRAGLTGDFAPLAQDPSLATFKGKDWAEVGPHLAKAFTETKKLVGAKTTLKLPDEHSTSEEVGAYRKANDIPDTPEEYVTRLRTPEGAGDFTNPEAGKEIVAIAVREGIHPKAFQAIMNWYGEQRANEHASFVREWAALDQQLRREWGPDFTANLGTARRAIKNYGGEPLIQLLTSFDLDLNPLIVKTFAGIGKDLMEHGAMPATGITHLTPDEAQERVKTLQADLLKVPHNSDPAKALIDQIIALTKIAQGRSA